MPPNNGMQLTALRTAADAEYVRRPLRNQESEPRRV